MPVPALPARASRDLRYGLAVLDPDASVRVGNDGYLRLPIGVRRACLWAIT